MTTTESPTDFDLLDADDSVGQHRNPVAGLMGCMAAFSGMGAAYVAMTRDDIGVVAQMGVVASVCGALAIGMARRRTAA